MDFTVRWRGDTVGVQGHGIGTFMRQTLCAFVFDHLDAEEVTSAAYVDNPASLAVSKKVGYSTNGHFREQRRPAELAISQKLSLNKRDLRRHDFDVQVDGLDPGRQLLGLGKDASPHNE